jgi:hypothetical protein
MWGVYGEFWISKTDLRNYDAAPKPFASVIVGDMLHTYPQKDDDPTPLYEGLVATLPYVSAQQYSADSSNSWHIAITPSQREPTPSPPRRRSPTISILTLPALGSGPTSASAPASSGFDGGHLDGGG